MADTIVDGEFAFDPMDQSKTKDFDFLSRIRTRHAVTRPADHLVYTSRYAETAAVFKDAKRFSSAGDMRAPGVTVPENEQFLGELDPPLHPRIRRILIRGFTPERALAVEPWTRAHVRATLVALRDRGKGDLMDEIGIPLPVAVSAHTLGIPDEQHESMHQWCNELLHSTWPAMGRTERGEGIAGAFPEFAAAIDELIAQRQDPAAGQPVDLLGIMVRTEADDGWRIHPQHVRTLAINILAGSLSTSYMIGNLLFRFLDDPQFSEALRADRSLIAPAVEETLRFEAPVTFLFRSAKADTTIGACPVHGGDHIMMGIASANRDDTVYERASEFRLDRSPNEPEHLAFGAGPHLCLGNHLTRMIGRVLLEELLDQFGPGELRLAEGFVWECVDHPMEYGPEHLGVVVESR